MGAPRPRLGGITCEQGRAGWAVMGEGAPQTFRGGILFLMELAKVFRVLTTKIKDLIKHNHWDRRIAVSDYFRILGLIQGIQNMIKRDSMSRHTDRTVLQSL